MGNFATLINIFINNMGHFNMIRRGTMLVSRRWQVVTGLLTWEQAF